MRQTILSFADHYIEPLWPSRWRSPVRSEMLCRFHIQFPIGEFITELMRRASPAPAPTFCICYACNKTLIRWLKCLPTYRNLSFEAWEIRTEQMEQMSPAITRLRAAMALRQQRAAQAVAFDVVASSLRASGRGAGKPAIHHCLELND